MLFISPPFGNYFNLPNTISIRGSYTLYPRPGRFMQIVKTLRYKPLFGGWVNKIGLRNPGIDYAIKTYKKNEIISLAIIDKDEIPILLKKIPKDMNLEINISCPNTGKKMISTSIEKFINKNRKWCILKLSPTETFSNIDVYYTSGFRQFHCSNTIPTPIGCLSGPMLKYFNYFLIKYIKGKYTDAVVIAGGGISTMNHIEFYKTIGADHFSVSSMLFNPITSLTFFKNYYFKDN